MTVVQIPLAPAPARMSVDLAGVTYRLRFTYNDAQDGCWVLDIGDAEGALLVAGIPLVTGIDLLAQHAHLDFGGGLYLVTDRGAGEVPGYADLGVTARLFFAEAA